MGVIGTLPEPEKGTDFHGTFSLGDSWGLRWRLHSAWPAYLSASQLAYQLGPIWTDLSKLRLIKHLAGVGGEAEGQWRRYFATEAILRHPWVREMPSFSMRERKVLLLRPSRSAAPSGPPITQSVSRNACRM